MIKLKPLFALSLMLTALLTGGCATSPLPAEAPPAPDQAQVTEATPPAKPAKQPALPAVMNEAQVMATVDPENSVFFKSGSAEIDTIGMQALKQHAARLKDDPKWRVRIIGYTDNQGSRAYNLAIAQERVNAVYSQLLHFGAPRLQIRRSAMGGEMANKSCKSAECRSRMRRVELNYYQP